VIKGLEFGLAFDQFGPVNQKHADRKALSAKSPSLGCKTNKRTTFLKIHQVTGTFRRAKSTELNFVRIHQ